MCDSQSALLTASSLLRVPATCVSTSSGIKHLVQCSRIGSVITQRPLKQNAPVCLFYNGPDEGFLKHVDTHACENTVMVDGCVWQLSGVTMTL